jgi:hypothetical protein
LDTQIERLEKALNLFIEAEKVAAPKEKAAPVEEDEDKEAWEELRAKQASFKKSAEKTKAKRKAQKVAREAKAVVPKKRKHESE